MRQETQQQPGEEAPEVQRPKTRREKLRERTGFGDKTAWDWMQLFIIPAVLVLGGYLLNSQQTDRQLETEERRAANQLEAEEERTQQEALQQYNNEMRSLLLEEDLLDSQEGDVVRELARARTLGVLDNLLTISKLLRSGIIFGAPRKKRCRCPSKSRFPLSGALPTSCGR